MLGDLSLGWIAAAAVPLGYFLAVVTALHAVMNTRTAQGAAAWAMALLAMPFITLPFYWTFGRRKFDNYIEAVEDFEEKVQVDLGCDGVLNEYQSRPEATEDARTACELRGFRQLATMPFTRGNASRLLVDGEMTFDAIIDGIDEAKRYILFQFYIIHDDHIGKRLHHHLMRAAERGVQVYLIYDDIGSHKLPRSFLKRLEQQGAKTSSFTGERSWFASFRLNFRNHRKIVVVDGLKAFMGGHNVGDEYLGRDVALSPWRDTHVEIEGPAVLALQYSFARDWYFAQKEIPDVSWDVVTHSQDHSALVLASGPADELETCGLLYTHAIESAEQRVWIASPYFVPDGRVLGALQLAALRGVDVRVLMPRKTDNILFRYVPYSYLPETERAGVKVFLHEPGFMHQKVMLIDNDYAAVGTANFDNRSFRLNFEVTYVVNNEDFCGELETMLENDFSNASELTREDLKDKSFFFRLAAQSTRILAPIL